MDKKKDFFDIAALSRSLAGQPTEAFNDEATYRAAHLRALMAIAQQLAVISQRVDKLIKQDFD